MAYGLAGHIGFGKETTWGTAVAVTDYFEALSETLTLAIDRFDTKNIVARLTEPDNLAGVKRVEGEIVLPGYPLAVGMLTNAAFGQGSRTITTVLSGFLWTTEWWPAPSDFSANAAVTPYTVEIFRDVTSSHQYPGGQVNALTLAVQPNQDARLSGRLIAQDTSVIAKTTPSFPGSPVIPLAFDTASVSIGGAATDLIEALTLTLIDNQLEGVPALNNSTVIARVRRRGPQIIHVAGTVAFDNLTEYANFVNQTEQRLFVNLFRANSFNLLVDIPRMVYTAFPVGMPGRERLTVAFEGAGRYHTGSGTPISVRLTTTKSNW